MYMYFGRKFRNLLGNKHVTVQQLHATKQYVTAVLLLLSDCGDVHISCVKRQLHLETAESCYAQYMRVDKSLRQ